MRVGLLPPILVRGNTQIRIVINVDGEGTEGELLLPGDVVEAELVAAAVLLVEMPPRIAELNDGCMVVLPGYKATGGKALMRGVVLGAEGIYGLLDDDGVVFVVAGTPTGFFVYAVVVGMAE